MSDLIRRDDAIEALAELARERFTIQDYFQIYLDALTAADIKIRQLPSIQPKRGKWNRLGMDALNCNRCGATFVINQGGEKMHFCPNCGADMREVTT